jgi:raffinose/stachyose/melibiose transport system substrate-binding protein
MKTKKSLLITLLIITAILLAACVPTSSVTEVPSDQQSQTTASSEGASQAPSKEEPSSAPEQITLVVWDQFSRDVESKVMETLNAEFEASHPGVRIERVVKTLDDLKLTLPLAMSQADGPDVAQVNQGRADMGEMVKQGLLLPLDEYQSKFQWPELMSTGVASRNSFTPDGLTFGQGNLYGASPTAEVVGVYYNKDIFAENGWTVPATFEEFQTLLADIKAKGITPISFGALDGWNLIHEFSAIQHLLVSTDYINNLVYGVNNVSFDTAENQQAAQILLDWANAGYFTEGYAGIGYDDENNNFKAGQGAMTITGSWIAGELLAAADGQQLPQFGFFTLPGFAGKPAMAIGGVGIPFSIRTGTSQPDLAAEYLDWMISPRAAELWAESGMVPAVKLPDDSTVDTSGLFGDTVKAWEQINAADTIGHYIDWAAPSFYDVLVSELQKVLGSGETPADFTANVEKVYAEFLQTLQP